MSNITYNEYNDENFKGRYTVTPELNTYLDEKTENQKIAEEIQMIFTKKINPPQSITETKTTDYVATEREYSKKQKDGNPKTSVGSRKFSLSTMSSAVTAEIAVGMLEGARKYGRHNWRDEGAMASIYWDAACRHLIKWWEGEDIDPDSGLPHIVKAMASLYVLRDAMINGNWVDDRPPALPEGWYENLDAAAAEIIERYPDARDPHLNKKGDA